MSCEHQAANWPHGTRTCAKCGQEIPEGWADRDRPWEAETLRFALDCCRKRYGTEPVGFERDVREKMARGEAEHRGKWRDPSCDLLAEVYDEPKDIPGHLLLWMTRERAGWSQDEFDQVFMLACDAMAEAADIAVKLARLRRLAESFG